MLFLAIDRLTYTPFLYYYTSDTYYTLRVKKINSFTHTGRLCVFLMTNLWLTTSVFNLCNVCTINCMCNASIRLQSIHGCKSCKCYWCCGYAVTARTPFVWKGVTDFIRNKTTPGKQRIDNMNIAPV